MMGKWLRIKRVARNKERKELIKAMHLEETLIIKVPFVIPIFGTSLQALYNHGFAKL
jgi:hypothetical protein